MSPTATPEEIKSTTRVVGYARPIRVLVANAKGGCGKTTLATNLASYFARQGEVTTLLDYDPQGSSTEWLKARGSNLPIINGIAAYRERNGGAGTLSWRLRVPLSTQRVVIDTPAGLNGNELSDLIGHTDILLIPVIPSAIDIRAATEFIRDVLLSQSYRQQAKPIAVIANRVKRNTLVYGKLEVFLKSLGIPFIATLRDTQFYVRASEHGFGLIDFDRQHEKDLEEWVPLMKWLNAKIAEITQALESKK